MLADYPANYRNKTGDDFLRHVPAAWDETKVLAGEVGDYITIARRRGSEWFMGSITDWTPREQSVSLGFLGEGNYTAQIYADGEDAHTDANSAVIQRLSVTAGDTMTIRMAPGGGHAVRFYPAPAE